MGGYQPTHGGHADAEPHDRQNIPLEQRQRPALYIQEEELEEDMFSRVDHQHTGSSTGRLWLDAEYIKQTIHMYGAAEGAAQRQAAVAARGKGGRIKSDFSDLNTPQSITE
jgi:hypothetical protein